MIEKFKIPISIVNVSNSNIPSSSLSYIDNQLTFHSTHLSPLINGYKTPFYLYSKSAILNNFNHFRENARNFFENVSIHYAMKANAHPEILKLLSANNCGADIVSLGEYKLAVKAGILPEQIIFSGVGKTREEIEFILNDSPHGIKSFNVESIDELELINEISKQTNKITPIAFRLNPNVHAKTHQHISTGGSMHKFGMTSDEIEMALAQTFSHIKLIGLSVHIGSQLKDMGATKVAALEMLELMRRNKLDDLSFLDFGGGLGIHYGPDDHDLTTPSEYFSQISDLISPYFQRNKTPEILFEPGRFITGNAGILVTQVVRIKNNGSKNFVILDAGMTELIRPALYDAYHEIFPIIKRDSPASREIYDFVGPICETGDFFAKDRESSQIKKHDLIVIGNCGSYAKCLASNYNARDHADEYFIEALPT